MRECLSYNDTMLSASTRRVASKVCHQMAVNLLKRRTNNNRKVAESPPNAAQIVTTTRQNLIPDDFKNPTNIILSLKGMKCEAESLSLFATHAQ